MLAYSLLGSLSITFLTGPDGFGRKTLKETQSVRQNENRGPVILDISVLVIDC
jgi:hypothetical protein